MATKQETIGGAPLHPDHHKWTRRALIATGSAGILGGLLAAYRLGQESGPSVESVRQQPTTLPATPLPTQAEANQVAVIAPDTPVPAVTSTPTEPAATSTPAKIISAEPISIASPTAAEKPTAVIKPATATSAPEKPKPPTITPKTETIAGAQEFVSHYLPYKVQLKEWQAIPPVTAKGIDVNNINTEYFLKYAGLRCYDCPLKSDIFNGGAIMTPQSTHFRTSAIVTHESNPAQANPGADTLSQSAKARAQEHLNQTIDKLKNTSYAVKDVKVTPISIGNGRANGWRYTVRDSTLFTSEYIFWDTRSQDGNKNDWRMEIHGDPEELKLNKEIDARDAFLKTWTPTT